MGEAQDAADTGANEAESTELIERISAQISTALIATDFDGTLAPIVPNPETVTPISGARDCLTNLSRVASEVAIISGRNVEFLSRFFPTDVTLVGLYGLETWRDGEIAFQSNAGVWRETMADVATAARLRGPEGMRVELKGLSITLHYRERPELAEEVEEYSRAAAASAGLRRRPARMSYELHPPIDEDKRTVLLRLAAAHSGPVVYFGDDVGDLPGFTALDEIEETGRTVLRVGVLSAEMSDELRSRSDLLVNGPEGALAVLSRFAG